MRKRMKVVAALAAVLALSGAFDIATRMRMTATVTPQFINNDGRRLTVLFHGIMGQNAYGQFRPLIDGYYARNGYDIIVVSTGGDVYDPDLVAIRAAEAIAKAVRGRSYERIVFDGASLGGRAAVDTRLQLQKDGITLRPSILLLEGSPLTAESIVGLKKYLIQVVAHVPFGDLANHVPAVSWMFEPPKWENIEKDPSDPAKVSPMVDVDAMQRQIAESKKTPLSVYSSQAASFAARDAYSNGSLEGLFADVVFLSFDRDTGLIDQRAAVKQWQAAFGKTVVRVIDVDSTHVGFAEAPKANIDAHGEALAA